MKPTTRSWSLTWLLLITLPMIAGPASAAELTLRQGDRLCLVGNALGERMQHHNYWETLLYRRHPALDLAVRNLCFPGDEPFQRIRSMNFGDPDQHLAHSRATVVLYFFGFNESFAGPRGLTPFAADMTRLVRETREKNYSGQGPPRVVLISPIAFENTRDPNLPDGRQHNERLAEYTAALRQVAEQTGAGFVDLFTPTKALFEQSDERLTLNGTHLNDAGYRALAPILDQGLFGTPVKDPGGLDGPGNQLLRRAIADKNFHWWHRYRAVNGYSIYGARGAAGSDGTYNNTDVMERERAILDQMTANRDRAIWSLAQQLSAGGPPPAALPPVDDSNTLPFIEPRTNVGLANDPNQKAGKLGSLDYLSADEQRKKFRLAPGFEIHLVASEEQFPELANPVALNFDNRGRLWVATMQSYPQWKPKTPLDDKLLILEDRDGDGRADDCRVFAGGLHQPTGFEIGRGGVYVAQQPDILFLQDTDGDDVADVRVRQLVGFDSADSHHGIAAFEWGPDGGLYFQEGTFKFSQVESPYGLTRLHEGGIWRYDPRTERFGVHVSLAFSNPWGHVFDRWGQDFIADASPGFSYWAAPISGRIDFPLKHPGGSQHRRLASQTGGEPGFAFPTFYPKRTRPSAGCELVSSRHFPDEMQGNFLLTNCIGDRAVLNHRVREEGSGFTGQEVEPLVFCDDGNFRPVDVQFGPDGALYIVDWHNALIGHLQHNLRDPSRDHSHGRIWRVTCQDRPLLVPPKIAGQPIPALLELLRAPEDRTRYQARRELAERETGPVRTALDRWVAELDPNQDGYEHLLLEALWVYQTHNVVQSDLLRQLLAARDHRARAAAVRALSFWLDALPESLELLTQLVNDSHPRPRLEAVRALSFYATRPRPIANRAVEIALDVLNHETDHYVEYTLDETLRALQPVAGAEDHAAGSPHAAHAAQPGPVRPASGADEPSPGALAASPPPLLFLNKSPRIVQFQLDRLPASQLLLAERSPTDARYEPLYRAIALRTGVSRQDRDEAVQALAQLTASSHVQVLLDAIARAGADKPAAGDGQVAQQLASILLGLPAGQLEEQSELLRASAASEDAGVRPVALAALISVGDAETAWSIGQRSPAARRDFLASVKLVPGGGARAAQRERIVACLDPAQ
ncbi:MAG: HEAT repeat domain-containing protein, partial [Pirellulaceae bacterium]|nr:HEAT repeat domain-containing protein [Pirellulaceae bacterium]